MTRVLLSLVLALLALTVAHAQTSAPQPLVRTTIDPERVVVGQKATLRIDVLAPNYMTRPPELPDFQVRNAVTRPLQSVNINEQQGGTGYAGVRFEFAIYPQEPGAYAIAGQNLTVHYAAEPPATRDADLALPPIDFTAFVPDTATAVRPFVAAERLTVTQTVQRSSEQLRTGDSLTRTVTINAEGTPAMLLPPQTFTAIDGLALYPAQPALDDHTDGRTDVLTSARTDSATYVLQRPGKYVLPAVDVGWWNVGEQRVERAHLDAIAIEVAANPDMPVASAKQGARRDWDGVVDFIWRHWLLAAIAMAALGAAIWIAPRLTRAIRARYQERRDAHLQSEAWSFHQFRRAAASGNAAAAYFALLNWLQRFRSIAPIDSTSSLKAAAGDPLLDGEIDSIEQRLFAQNARAGGWSSGQLSRRVGAARRMLRRKARHGDAARPLPPRLNPIDEGTGADRTQRLPAR
jgi:hypothetical protein